MTFSLTAWRVRVRRRVDAVVVGVSEAPMGEAVALRTFNTPSTPSTKIRVDVYTTARVGNE